MVAAGADAEAQRRMAEHVEEASSALRTLNLSPETSGWFEGLAQHVVSRSH
jgi:geranylgeranyl pyrophosphate synthase